MKRDQLHQGFGAAVGDMFVDFVAGYVAIGLHAEGYKPDLNTDAGVLYILSRQTPEGNWPYPRGDTRPPICLNYISQTAIAMHALQLYAPKPVKPAADKAVRQAALWLAKAKPSSNEDRSWRLQGLVWAGADKAATQKAMKDLLAAQRPDGGWSDLPGIESSAFATGESLVALHDAGLPASGPEYQRGVKFLLDTQQENGSWYVKTRALASQPPFDAGFSARRRSVYVGRWHQLGVNGADAFIAGTRPRSGGSSAVIARHKDDLASLCELLALS